MVGYREICGDWLESPRHRYFKALLLRMRHEANAVALRRYLMPPGISLLLGKFPGVFVPANAWLPSTRESPASAYGFGDRYEEPDQIV